MRHPKIEQISEGAYFVFEPSSFDGSILNYDPIMANQTIVSDCCAFPRPTGGDQQRTIRDQQSLPPSQA